ncbi:MAG: sulfatase-like hydrolase/transferase [Bryobacteraceae bacterium]
MSSVCTRRELLASTAAPLMAAPRRRPNILFILSDDHHYQCLGAAGNPHIHTPNLDRLAARGVRFSNAQISTPQCAPSRDILLSSLETYQNGLISNGQIRFREGLGPVVVEQLRRTGYDTVLAGKWHIANRPEECGFARAPLWLPGGGSVYRNPKLCHGLESKPTETSGHITDLLTGAALDCLRQAGEQPFFLWLAYNAPHTPWYAEARYTDLYAGKDAASIAPPAHPPGGLKFNWNLYYSVITHMDEAIGRLIAELDRRNLWKNTIVFFLGDNGFTCGSHNWIGKVYPWEESVRVPFIAAGAGVARGRVSDAPVASIDLPRTWLDLAHLAPPSPLAGRSLVNTLQSGLGGPEYGFSVWDDGRLGALAVKTTVDPYRLVRTRTHKLIAWQSGKQALYDIRTDVGEEHNLLDSGASARIASDLRSALVRRMKETGDKAIEWLTRYHG